jgi:hypothetical protein
MGRPMLEPETPAPKLDGTLDSCDRLTQWVVENVAAGSLAERRGETILMGVAKQQTSIRERHRQDELAMLAGLAKSMEDAVSRRVQREKADRYTATGSTTSSLGRVRVSDDSKH